MTILSPPPRLAGYGPPRATSLDVDAFSLDLDGTAASSMPEYAALVGPTGVEVDEVSTFWVRHVAEWRPAHVRVVEALGNVPNHADHGALVWVDDTEELIGLYRNGGGQVYPDWQRVTVGYCAQQPAPTVPADPADDATYFDRLADATYRYDRAAGEWVLA
jgi:hypothetical protein